ncbi:MAG TPA: ferritin-like fold-containing protein [Polyangiaceae bacterium]|nr:ferritin-like fold-containing protein [Polyangiaceae bacterium]
MSDSDERTVQLLERQGFRELVSSHLFTAGVVFAPTLDDKIMLLEHAREELTHFEVVSSLYEKLTGRSLFDHAATHASHLPAPKTWLEAAVAGYLVDRAAAAQLRDYLNVKDARLGAVIREIHEHEHEHQAAAETALLDQCRNNPAAALAARPHVEKWFKVALSVLDAQGGPDAERVGAAFAAGVRGTLAACGLTVPESPRSDA